MPVNTISDEDFLFILNKLSEYESTSENFQPITSLDQNITETNLDSLGIMMLFMWLDTAFGVSEEDGKRYIEQISKDNPTTGQSIVDFIKETQTKCFTMKELEVSIKELLGG